MEPLIAGGGSNIHGYQLQNDTAEGVFGPSFMGTGHLFSLYGIQGPDYMAVRWPGDRLARLQLYEKRAVACSGRECSILHF